jgi:hypothetical protein
VAATAVGIRESIEAGQTITHRADQRRHSTPADV